MLRYMLQNSDFSKDKFLQGSALRAAEQIIQWGDVSRPKILFLDGKPAHQPQNLDFFRLIIKAWSTTIVDRHSWDFVFDLVDYI